MRLLRQEQDLLQTKITDFLTLSRSGQLVESLPSYIPDWNLKKAPLLVLAIIGSAPGPSACIHSAHLHTGKPHAHK